jgi:excisionase family DNA binding protein
MSKRRRDTRGIPKNRRERRQSARLAYTIAQLAKVVGVGRSTLYSEIAAGRLVPCKAGRRTLITRERAKEWLFGLPTGLTPVCDVASDDSCD